MLGPATAIPWCEPNETDPHWPDAYLMGEYQTWEEGGDGALFRGTASFRGAHFRDAAWFWKVRFGAAAVFRGASFDSRVYLDQPAADLTGARAAATDLEQRWPLGWTTVPADDGPAGLATDAALAPYAHQLAAAEPSVRLAGLRILDMLGDARPESRAEIVTAVCAYLHGPVRHDGADLGEEHFGLTGLPRRHTARATLESLLTARPAP